MIRNLLFDLGGVVMDIRRQNCIEAFRDLGMEHPENFLGEYVQAGPFKGVESGELSPRQFYDVMRPYLRPGTSDSEIRQAFCRFLIGIPEHRLNALRALRSKGYGVYLLSNTNPVMWNSKIAEEFRQQGEEGPEAYFDGMVTSFEAKVMKPDPGIFTYAAATLGIKPEETLFLDDSQANLDAAARLGFHTLLVAPGSEFETLLSREGF